MITKRIIPCLDVRDGRVVKGVNFQGLSDVSDPVELARDYSESGADELVFYDITASAEGRKLFTDILCRVAQTIFIPLTVGGGVNTLEDFDRVLKCGADKVSVNSGAIRNPELIRRAALLAMFAGADFVKTSTGKIDVAATPEAAVVMCRAIRDYYDKTGRMVGFKPAGGVRSAADAVLYYTVVREILGERWLTPQFFRIGASSVANALLSAIVGEPVKYY